MHGGGVELSLHSPLKGISPFNFCRNIVPLCRDVTKIKHYKNGLVSSGSPLHTGTVVEITTRRASTAMVMTWTWLWLCTSNDQFHFFK